MSNASSDPLVSIITINYNSKPKMEVILECVKSMLEIRWRPLEIIFVDNGSTDGSFEELKNFTKSIAPSGIRLIFLPMGKNLGFARGNNEGLLVADPSSKYVVILNNDLAPDPDSLDKLVRFLESKPLIAGVQPVIKNWDSPVIDSAGGVLSSWGASGVAKGLPISFSMVPFYVTHIYGAYSVYRIAAIRRSKGLFLSQFFMYGDDYELGVRLWASGYGLATIPAYGGKHYSSSTVSRYKPISYYAVKNETAVLVMYSGLFSVLVIFRTLGLLTYCLAKNKPDVARAFLDGLLFGSRLRHEVPKYLKNGFSRVPRPRFSIPIWFLMHSHYSYLAQNWIAKDMIKRYAISKIQAPS
jgi:GT2 family glycosyltransferase